MTTVTAAVAASANVTISTGLVPGQTLNGRTLVAGDLVLLPAQSDATQNGLYRSAEAPERDREYSVIDLGAEGAYDRHSGLVVVDQHNGAVYLCSSAPGGTLGTDDLTFDKVSDAGNTPYLDATQTWTGINYFRGQEALKAMWDEDSTSAGPYMDLYRDVNLTTIPATAGVLRYAIKNSDGDFKTMAQISARITDDTSGSEDASLQFQTIIAGAFTTVGYWGAGIFATGLTDQGEGTINFDTYYRGNTAFEADDWVWTGTHTFKGGANAQTLDIRYWESTGDSDINGLVGGTTEGILLAGPVSRHTVFSLRENGSNDTFSWVTGGGNWTSDNTYDTLAMQLDALGNLKINGEFIEQGRSVQTIASGTITIADDAVGYVDTIDDYGIYGGLFIIAGSQLNNLFPQPEYALSFFDVGTSLNHISIARYSGVDFNSGSWGSVASVTDGNIGIGVHATGGYQIINRRGGSRTFTWYALGTY